MPSVERTWPCGCTRKYVSSFAVRWSQLQCTAKCADGGGPSTPCCATVGSNMRGCCCLSVTSAVHSTDLKSTQGSSNSSNGTKVDESSRLLNSVGYQNSFSAASATMLLLRPLSGLTLLPRGPLLPLSPLLLPRLALLGGGAVATLLLLLLLLLLVLTVLLATAAVLLAAAAAATVLDDSGCRLMAVSAAAMLGVACCSRSSAAASALRSATRLRFCSTLDCVACRRCSTSREMHSRTATKVSYARGGGLQHGIISQHSVSRHCPRGDSILCLVAIKGPAAPAVIKLIAAWLQGVMAASSAGVVKGDAAQTYCPGSTVEDCNPP